MNWHNLATKNMLRNLRRYLGYLLAATLAVMIFAMFTNFVDNPAVRDAPITAIASQILVVFRVLVALFAIFFVFYFHAALIRARNKEFGLLLTLGVTPRQIGRLIFYESLLIGLLALLLFLLPISLAIVHSVVALLDFAKLMVYMNHSNLFPKLGVTTVIMRAFVPVSLLYLASFMVYFWIARVSYLRRIQLATA